MIIKDSSIVSHDHHNYIKAFQWLQGFIYFLILLLHKYVIYDSIIMF